MVKKLTKKQELGKRESPTELVYKDFNFTYKNDQLPGVTNDICTVSSQDHLVTDSDTIIRKTRFDSFASVHGADGYL